MKRYRTVGIALAAAIGAAATVLLLPRRDGPAEVEVTVGLANRNAVIRGFPEWGSTNQSPTARGTLPYVVVCAGRADKTLRLAVEAAGARVVGYFPPDAFQVEANREALRKLSADPRIAAATEFLPGDKVDERLAALLRTGADAVEVSVLSLVPEDRDGLRKHVTSRGGELLRGCLNGRDSFRARIPAALVGELAKRGEVRWMEPFARPKLLNDLAVESAAMNVRETWDAHGLSGTNQVVSTSDSGIDTGDVATMHRDLADRICGIGVVEGCNPTDQDGHGTHTAGSIVGNGTMSDGTVRGTAWGAKLWAWFCDGADGYIYTPDDYGDLFRPDQANWPTFIHSASWGDDKDGAYDAQCADVDWYVWEHPDFLPVFANGNAGPGAGTVDSPAAAKNVLAVGATQNLRTTPSMGWPDGQPEIAAEYSSHGPCKDGRVKPDVTAPGTGILSTRAYACSYFYGIGANTNYAYSCGTSMATPLTAGAMALVREWIVDRCGFTNETPSAALMKAVVTGGAKGSSVPNNDQGWGRVDLEETLFPSNRAVKLVDRIPFDAGKTFTYLVETTNAAPLDVQLVWIDYPASSGSQQSRARLVNDLDLTVSAVTNGVAQDWIGNGGGAPDRLNTAESVRIASAPAAVYCISVCCTNIVYESATGGAAALYIRGAFDPDSVEEPDLVTISVSVEAGTAEAGVSPSVGVRKVEKGTAVTFSAPEWAYQYGEQGTPSARQAFLGFVGTGDAPASGSEREFRVTVSNDTSVVWRYDEWVSDYLFAYCAYLEGVPEGDYNPYVYETWLTNGTVFSMSFPDDAVLGDPYSYTGYYKAPGAWLARPGTYRFRLGAVAYAQTDSDDWYYLLDERNGEMWRSVDITMDEGVDLWCCYFNETELSTGGLLYWWYMRYLWGGEMMFGYDSSVTGDPDGDGFGNAAEYDDATDPVDDGSFRFRIDAFTPTGMTFTGSVKGNLIVERSDRPDGPWKGVQTNFPPRTSTANSVRIEGNGSSNCYYRVNWMAD